MNETLTNRIASMDWGALSDALDDRGFCVTDRLLDADDCRLLVSAYGDESAYRKTIAMGQHVYGEGEYKYYRYPLPPIVGQLRQAFYPPLASIANRWSEALNLETTYPATLEGYLRQCQQNGQRRPTPLILHYEAGGYNRLHQDLYGDLHFPLQLAILLSRPGRDFSGGEFLLTEQRPRVQTRAHVVPLTQGQGVIFAVHQRPAQGKRGFYRVTVRHGVGELRSGDRYTLGIIFHDAA